MSTPVTHLIARPRPALLSLVLPIHDEEESIPHLRKALEAFRDVYGSPVEFILVDDGSRDRSLPLMIEWANQDPQLKVISLARNFGHQIAATAGVDVARGDAVVIMDADLQDPPEVVLKMVERYCEGYDVAYGQRIDRSGESNFKLFTAALFYRLMKRFVDPRLPENTGDFRLMSRKVVEALKRVRERDRFLRGIVAWLGHPQIAVPYSRPARVAGETKYPFFKMVRLALTAVTTFSDFPIRLVTWMGFGSFLISMVLTLRTLWLAAFGREQLVLGWASLSVMVSFFAGMILVSIGILGMYVGRIFVEVQQRPLYLVQYEFNLDVKHDGQ